METILLFYICAALVSVILLGGAVLATPNELTASNVLVMSVFWPITLCIAIMMGIESIKNK